MGGSIAVKTARRLETDLKDTPVGKALSGLAVIDVVEGTAMEALPFMEQIVLDHLGGLSRHGHHDCFVLGSESIDLCAVDGNHPDGLIIND